MEQLTMSMVANKDDMIARQRDEIDRLRAAIAEARSVAALDGLKQWVEHFDKALHPYG